MTVPTRTKQSPAKKHGGAVTAVSESRLIKRRTRAEMDEYRAAVAKVLEEIQPATVRQLYYQLVSRRDREN